MLTGIDNEMVATAPSFSTVAQEFFDFIQTNVDAVETTSGKKISQVVQVVLVAHNGHAFDAPFFLQALERNNLQHLWLENDKLGYVLDTLPICRSLYSESSDDAKPTDNKLATLYQFFTGNELEANHHALEDVKALYVVLRRPNIWNRRAFHIKYCKDGVAPTPPTSNTNDSDDDNDESDDEQEDNNDNESSEENTVVEDLAPLGDYWSSGDFEPERSPQELFEEYFKSTNRSGKMSGIQVPPAYANSPIKAWRLIFTTTILERLVKHTNTYGELHAGEDEHFKGRPLWHQVYRPDQRVARDATLCDDNGAEPVVAKIIFYLLDVGTSNALVLYNEAMKGKQDPLNIVEYKTLLVEALVGQKLKDLARDKDDEVEHAMVKLPGSNRQRCRCEVPFCSIGSGKTTKDCFALAHDNDHIREICRPAEAHNQKKAPKEKASGVVQIFL